MENVDNQTIIACENRAYSVELNERKSTLRHLIGKTSRDVSQKTVKERLTWFMSFYFGFCAKLQRIR